ncbi:MAG TPA: Gfo/Idh/MocA family oxidoreductase [Thermoleophilaceae bacterium]
MTRVGILGDDPRPHVEAFVSLGCEIVLGQVEEMLPKVDAIVVASAADERFHHTALALEHELDVLVEQPVAPTTENAWMLERIASLRPSQPVVQVSQPEAFDPALKRLAEHEPVSIDLRRRGEAPLEADAHTLLSLARSPLVKLHACGGPRLTVATLVFESGLIGTLSTGVVGPASGCTVRAEGEEGSIVVDLTPAFVAQAASFLEAIRHRTRPATTLRNAIACMEVAAGIRECLAVQAAASGSGVL